MAGMMKPVKAINSAKNRSTFLPVAILKKIEGGENIAILKISDSKVNLTAYKLDGPFAQKR